MIRFENLIDSKNPLGGEAYTKSNYLFHEQVLMDFFIGLLMNLGYTCCEPSGRVWTRGSANVIVCLADDAFTFGTNSDTPVGHKISTDTVVITDNSFLGSPKHTILKMPDSYFGIYSYEPEYSDWQPTKRFNFSINRFCEQRLLILLELIHQTGGVDNLLAQDYINFNVWNPNGNNEQIEHIRSNFTTGWGKVNPAYQAIYSQYMEQLTEEIPICNHNFTHNQVHVSAWMNLVVETYAGDTNRTVSEKTFRALVTPAPWTLYACRYTVEMLKTMGFDVLDDIIDHGYNKFLQSNGIQKIQQFVAGSIENQRRLAEMDFDKLKTRCVKAAQHNQQLLAKMRKQFPLDFVSWLPTVIKHIE